MLGPRKDVFAALAGDAMHFFPPDLGQGVNSGLEDVYALGRAVDRYDEATLMRDQTGECLTDTVGADTVGAFAQALREYESERTAEAGAIAKIMTYGYPYQYNQAPLKGRLYVLNFALRLGLNKLLAAVPWLNKAFNPPAFFMVQQSDPPLRYQVS